MEQGTQLALMVSLLSKKQILSILKEEIELWENAPAEKQDEIWKELAFKASLILMKDLAPDIETAMKMGDMLDKKFTDPKEIEDAEQFLKSSSPFKSNKDIN